MMAASGIFLLLLFAIISVFGQDNDTVTSNRGVFVKVLGNSGKISLSRNSANESDVVIEFDAIGEKAADGSTDVGRGGSPTQKHVFNTFANQQFQFSGVRNGTYRNISAKTFNFAANISSGAKLLVDVYIFSENGTFSLGDENTTVSEGSVKFNIQIDNWKFCGSDSGAVECKQGQTLQVGKYLDFTISIKGKGANPQKKTGGKKRTTADEYDLGGGSVVLSNKVKYDGGQWVNMPSGYPNVVTQGSKQLFVFRFENFTKGLLYDPQVDLDPAATNTTTVTTTTTLAPPPDSPSGANQDGIYVKVTGRSGKIQLGNKADPSSDPDRITIEFSDLTEKKSDGTDIKDRKHAFNNFAKTDFVFTPLVGAVYPNTSINVKKFTFKSNLNDAGATLETEVYIFKEDGNITLGNENTIIHKGNMKFSTTIANWTFCGHAGVPTCTQSETGAFLDFGIVIKGKGTPRKKSAGEKHRGDSDEYELADNGAAVVMSKKVKYNNGNWEDMATGYPKLDTQGGKQIFIIRFSNFTGKAYYDPTVVYTASPTNGSNRNLGSIITFALIILICSVLF